MAEFLFDKGPAAEAVVRERARGTPRLRGPQRAQIEWHDASLDELLDADHPARTVWEAVCGLDLSAWLDEVQAVEGEVGRNRTDPRLLVALWVYATIDGIVSARELARRCERGQGHLPYRWLCGGVTVNHHLLSDFRSDGGEKWDALLTQIVAALLSEELVALRRMAQDGVRVRADAGKSSFRRRPTLEECLREAEAHVAALRLAAEDPADRRTAGERAARERAARERQERVAAALRECEELQRQRDERSQRTNRKAKEARASTTDPEARVMQFSDGGFRPGWNVQFATDVDSGIIVGVETTNVGNDSEQLLPMLVQLQERYERVPAEALVDGGYVSRDAIDQAATRHGCTVFAPLKDEQRQLAAGTDPHAKKKGDTPAVADWRARMATELARTVYRLRGQTAEWVNALARNRGLQRMPVRGQPKCRTVALLYAIAHDLLQAVHLRTKAAAEALARAAAAATATRPAPSCAAPTT